MVAAAGLPDDHALHEADPEATPTGVDEAAAGVDWVGTTGIVMTGTLDEAAGTLDEATGTFDHDTGTFDKATGV